MLSVPQASAAGRTRDGSVLPAASAQAMRLPSERALVSRETATARPAEHARLQKEPPSAGLGSGPGPRPESDLLLRKIHARM